MERRRTLHAPRRLQRCGAGVGQQAAVPSAVHYSQIDLNSAAGAEAPSVLLIYTGGTIGMAVTRADEHLVAFDFARLLKHIPELQLFRVKLTVLSREVPID